MAEDVVIRPAGDIETRPRGKEVETGLRHFRAALALEPDELGQTAAPLPVEQNSRTGSCGGGGGGLGVREGCEAKGSLTYTKRCESQYYCEGQKQGL